MNSSPTSHALALVSEHRFQDVASHCESEIKRLTLAGLPIDPRLFACQAIACAQLGLLDRAKELLSMVWRYKRTILKWGIRGVRFIMLIATLIAFPDRIHTAIDELTSLMQEA
ncbi:MAG: hypothetical protein ACYC67_22075 [Prosthecobacter sp.]